MKTAVDQLIALAECLTPSGEIGPGMVAQFHAAAKRARAERAPPPEQDSASECIHAWHYFPAPSWGSRCPTCGMKV